jgi:hypothetical protein
VNFDFKMSRDGEIVGLKECNNGRSCFSHSCCGEYLQLDDLICFRSSVADINGKVEEVVSVVRVREGTESCVVGFLPMNILKGSKDKFIGMFAQIIELYKCSESDYKSNK